jgi:VWFA-related protein
MLLRGIALLLALGGVAPPQDEVVIRTTTSLVEVRVVVEDKDGAPIANLERSNFEILDNGQPQPIRLFAAYRGVHPPLLANGAASEDASTSVSPTPSEYALLVLDGMNTDYEGRVRVQ